MLSMARTLRRERNVHQIGNQFALMTINVKMCDPVGQIRNPWLIPWTVHQLKPSRWEETWFVQVEAQLSSPGSCWGRSMGHRRLPD